MKFLVPDFLKKEIAALHPHIKSGLRASMDVLVKNPHAGKDLRDELSGLRSYKMGRYRVIYKVTSPKLIELVSFGPRVRIYQETLSLLKKDKAQVSS